MGGGTEKDPINSDLTEGDICCFSFLIGDQCLETKSALALPKRLHHKRIFPSATVGASVAIESVGNCEKCQSGGTASASIDWMPPPQGQINSLFHPGTVGLLCEDTRPLQSWHRLDCDNWARLDDSPEHATSVRWTQIENIWFFFTISKVRKVRHFQEVTHCSQNVQVYKCTYVSLALSRPEDLSLLVLYFA